MRATTPEIPGIFFRPPKMVCTTPFSKVASVALVAVRKTQHAVMVIAQALAKTTEGGWFFIDESGLAASSKGCLQTPSS